MAVHFKPADMPTLTPALPGGARLIEFAKRVLGAETVRLYPMGDRVAHAEIRIGESLVMTGDPMGADALPPASVHVYVPDCDAAYGRALAAGARTKQEPKDQFYGDRTARVVDPFGNQWSFATHVEDVSEDELMRRMKALEGGG
ncbi:MAG: glyoxalase/bleomycin resistance/extradiol dioxygenase family protein [Polyangiaceae bacterium]|nr:glyoxalase/bleomycin resistance/extradiol dioxygenase family protein [Polyangiaceae bacterium]